MKKVYISATYSDLREHREAVAHALRKMGYEVRCMEDYVATDERTDARCTQDVASCDFYVGIFAQRYGWIPPGQDCSITELEYRQARSQAARTRCLLWKSVFPTAAASILPRTSPRLSGFFPKSSK